MAWRRELADSLTLVLLGIAIFTASAGCRTWPMRDQFDLTQPGWTIKHGQAIWRPAPNKPELAGEFLLAVHSNGSSLVQFTKNPFPILTGRTSPTDWEIEFAPQQRTIRGRGQPSDRFMWLHAGGILIRGDQAPSHWSTTIRPEMHWEFTNPATGEMLKGYLDP